MRVLVNFLPLLGRGGGRQNALNLWATASRQGGAGHRWLAVARPNLGLEDVALAGGMDVDLLPVRGLADRIRAENVGIPRRARAFGADVVFTPMGTGPLRGRAPRVAGWHDSTAVYPDVPMWQGTPAATLAVERIRAGYAGMALRRAARVCVQTGAMARRVAAAFGVAPERIRIVPNGPSTFLADDREAPLVPASPRRILLVTTAQPAKNLDVIPRVARALARAGVRDAEIVVTLGAAEWEAWSGAPSARSGAWTVPVRCVGAVPHADLGALYRSGAAVLVPSWVESFTAVYAEAWHFGLPVVTSDLDFARELCGDGALFAPPERADLLAGALARALDDTDLRARLRAAGRTRLAALPTWDERLALYVAALEEAVAFP